METEAPVPAKVILAETNALAALTFYAHNYTTLMFAGLGAGNKQIVLGSKPLERRFC
jgi:homoserine dehydrogenase